MLLRRNSSWTAQEADAPLCFISKVVGASCHPSSGNHGLQGPQKSSLVLFPGPTVPNNDKTSLFQKHFSPQTAQDVNLGEILAAIHSDILSSK